jgi:hypothetical protein
MNLRAAEQAMDDRKRRVERRAYELWETEGRVHGRALDHWVRAERETGEAQNTDAGTKPEAAPPRSRKVAPRKRSGKVKGEDIR